MRVGIIALLHESNTFIRTPTTLGDFERGVLLSGAAVREHYAVAHHEVGGFFAGLQDAGIEAVPIFAASTIPSGTITTEAFESLLAQMFLGLDAAGPLDALLVAAHGAAVCKDFPDMDGRWLSLLRERIGAHMPLVCTLDPHANLSAAMVRTCTATLAYRTNPHLDQRERGIEAARLIARTLKGEIRPTQAAAFPAIAINIERQLTAASPCRELCEQVERVRQVSGVLSASLILGFPYADVEKMGSSFVVVTDNNPALAEQLAGELQQYLLSHREDFRGQFIDIDAALDKAATLRGPVCLLDMGDNVGGGSPADGTTLLHALQRREIGRAFACIFDPESVAQALATGVGATLPLKIGGKSDSLHGAPLKVSVRVRSVHDGRFTETAPRHGGAKSFDMGQSVVVESERGMTLLLTSRRTAPFSLGALTSCNIDPQQFQLIVAKGVHAPVAAYAQVCPHFIRVNTPGVTAADMTSLTYTRRRQPLFPFEPL